MNLQVILTAELNRGNFVIFKVNTFSENLVLIHHIFTCRVKEERLKYKSSQLFSFVSASDHNTFLAWEASL